MPNAHSLCLSTPQGQILNYPTPQYQAFKGPVLFKGTWMTIAFCMFSPTPLQPLPLVSDTVVRLGTLALWSPFPASMWTRTLRTRWLSACDGLSTQCLAPLQFPGIWVHELRWWPWAFGGLWISVFHAFFKDNLTFNLYKMPLSWTFDDITGFKWILLLLRIFIGSRVRNKS